MAVVLVAVWWLTVITVITVLTIVAVIPSLPRQAALTPNLAR